MTTMVLPANSSSLASRIAATAAPPHELPEMIPSSPAARHPPRALDGFLVGDLFHTIHDGKVEVVGNEPGAQALDFVRAWLELLPVALLRDDRALDRLDRHRQ